MICCLDVHLITLLGFFTQFLLGCSAEATTEEVVEVLFFKIPLMGWCEAQPMQSSWRPFSAPALQPQPSD
jgi:hypothetical protein